MSENLGSPSELMNLCKQRYWIRENIIKYCFPCQRDDMDCSKCWVLRELKTYECPACYIYNYNCNICLVKEKCQEIRLRDVGEE